MTTLEQIAAKLQTLDNNVFFGVGDPRNELVVWDYIVFRRDSLRASEGRTGYTYYYTVGIVRENCIPEGLEQQVIDKMLEIPGMRLSAENQRYAYETRPSTSAVVELCVLTFFKAEKV